MSKYKPIPITAARHIAISYAKSQVIIVTWDDVHKLMHVTTYGNTTEACDQAAMGGDKVKRALGWPESAINALPSRVRKLKQENDALRSQVKDLLRRLEKP